MWTIPDQRERETEGRPKQKAQRPHSSSSKEDHSFLPFVALYGLVFLFFLSHQFKKQKIKIELKSHKCRAKDCHVRISPSHNNIGTTNYTETLRSSLSLWSFYVLFFFFNNSSVLNPLGWTTRKKNKDAGNQTVFQKISCGLGCSEAPNSSSNSRH